MKDDKEHIMPESPEATILLRYIKEIASEEEKEIVKQWLGEDDANEKELLQIARIYYAEQTKNRILSRDPLEAYYKTDKVIQRKKQRLLFRRVASVAAFFAGVAILSAVFSYLQNQKEEITPQMVTVTSNTGMRTQFNLPDGTIVYLNSGSTFTYPVPYDKNERKVNLVGEAFFKVARRENQPFIVNVHDEKFNIKVLGTEFNVQAYENDDEINTTLVSGSVVLEYKNNQGDLYKQSLSPSEKAVYNRITDNVNTMIINNYDNPSDTISKKEQMNIRKVNTKYETAWIEGKLMFDDTPLPEVLKRLSHYYNVGFQVNDPVLKSYRFTGTLVERELSQVLDYLKLSSHIDYRIHPLKEDDSNGRKYTMIELWKNN